MPAYKYTLKDGKTTRWYANFSYTDWTGQKRRVCKRGFKTQREAKEYERSFCSRQNDSSDILFSDLVENYLADMENRLKPTTMENKRNIIKTKILPYFGRLKICEISTLKVRSWQNELLNATDSKGNGYSQTYLRVVNNQLSAVMNYAVRHYHLAVNPCTLSGSIGRSRAGEMKIWTREEYESFSSQIRRPAIRLAFDILFYTGIRVGELLALTPADILPDKKIDISKNYARVNGEELILTPKTPKGVRKVTIPDFLYDDIQKYISRLYGIEDNDRIFYFAKDTLELEIKNGAAKAGLKPIRVHDLRHSHVSMLIDMGVSIVEISRRLGHESVKTTLDTYAHMYPDSDRILADRLNAFRRPEETEKSGQ